MLASLVLGGSTFYLALGRMLLDFDMYRYSVDPCLPLTLRTQPTASLTQVPGLVAEGQAEAHVWALMTEQRFLVEVFGYHRKK